MNIIIKSFRNDLYTFLQLQKDIIANSLLNGTVNIIVPKEDLQQFRARKCDAFQIHADQEILASVHYHGPYRSNWYSQQVVKLASCAVLDGDYHLILDSNTLINRPLATSDLKINNKWVYEVNQCNKEDLEFEKSSFQYLGFENKPLKIRNVNQVLMKRHVIDLLAYIERKFSRNAVDSLIESARYPIMSWTEFHLYGAWLDRIKAPEYEFAEKNWIATVNWMKYSQNPNNIIKTIATKRPLMVKLYKKRANYLMPDVTYDELVRSIKSLYLT